MASIALGSGVATAKGERLVEELRVGEAVMTRRRGLQPIRWIGRRDLSGRALIAAPHLNPVMVRQGAISPGRPERDLVLSPNTRLRVARGLSTLHHDTPKANVAAKRLAGLSGITGLTPLRVSYVQLMLAVQDDIMVNGCWVECFHPVHARRNGGGNAQITEMLELFPALAEPPKGPVRPPAREREALGPQRS